MRGEGFEYSLGNFSLTVQKTALDGDGSKRIKGAMKPKNNGEVFSKIILIVLYKYK